MVSLFSVGFSAIWQGELAYSERVAAVPEALKLAPESLVVGLRTRA
jgi:hypothetical protein